ncbi:MAG: PhoH family protein [Gammaproteobacteria bacterium]|nr:MAG: PhoH family protein [Gammaproteobacteria bacterium]
MNPTRGTPTGPVTTDVLLEPADKERLASLCGQFDEHLRQIEGRLGVEISSRGNRFRVIGEDAAVRQAANVLRTLYAEAERQVLTPAEVHLALQQAGAEAAPVAESPMARDVVIRTRAGIIRGRGLAQRLYLARIAAHDLSFGIGPAGTGKTYLAVASAVHALDEEQVRRIILVRPAVEAGERLGFLPGDMAQKVDPYLRPLYDALYEMLGFEKVNKLMERHVIEVAPLAYMRGRTLNEAFIILDEAQNATVEQMKMFLTRIGFGSKAVVTGDVTQIDLPRGVRSGLRHVVEVLQGVEGVSFTFFGARDVVRHPLVQRIIEAYQSHDGDRDPHD